VDISQVSKQPETMRLVPAKGAETDYFIYTLLHRSFAKIPDKLAYRLVIRHVTRLEKHAIFIIVASGWN